MRTTPGRLSGRVTQESYHGVELEIILLRNCDSHGPLTPVSHCKNHLPTLNQEFQLAIMSVEAVFASFSLE